MPVHSNAPLKHAFVKALPLCLLLLSACPKGADTSVPPGDNPPGPGVVIDAGQFTEMPMPLADSGIPKRPLKPQRLGGDCSVWGNAECVNGLCLAYETASGMAQACSVPCESTKQCLSGWTCVSVFPGEGNAFCVPPSGWSGVEVGP
jgi:hypothetical protein